MLPQITSGVPVIDVVTGFTLQAVGALGGLAFSGMLAAVASSWARHDPESRRRTQWKHHAAVGLVGALALTALGGVLVQRALFPHQEVPSPFLQIIMVAAFASSVITLAGMSCATRQPRSSHHVAEHAASV